MAVSMVTRTDGTFQTRGTDLFVLSGDRQLAKLSKTN